MSETPEKTDLKQSRPKNQMSGHCIYVASLAAYNNGVLHGEWIDADQDADSVNTEIEEMLADSPYEGDEWAIHAYEGFGKIKLSETEDIATVCELAAALEEHGEAFEIFYENDTFDDVADAVDKFGQCYRGCHKSREDYAEDFLTEIGDIPKDLPSLIRNNIDWSGIARELEIGGDVWFEDGSDGVHVFENM